MSDGLSSGKLLSDGLSSGKLKAGELMSVSPALLNAVIVFTKACLVLLPHSIEDATQNKA